MPDIKALPAKQSFKLDCGCTMQAHQLFMVTKFFVCEQTMMRLLRLMMTPHRTSQTNSALKKQPTASPSAGVKTSAGAA